MRRGIIVAAALLAIAAAWYIGRPSSPAPGTAPDAAVTREVPEPDTDRVTKAETPTTSNDSGARSERSIAGSAGAKTARPRPDATAATAAPTGAAAPPELRVTSDVAGAYVFLDRKFLGPTPLVSRDVTPGTHQLNVQVEGRDPVVQTVDIAETGPTSVAVTIAKPRDTSATVASVDVVHQHGVGSCSGTLTATGETLKYTAAGTHGFSVPLASIDAFTIDYAERRLRVRQRGGKTWNFGTKAETADPLFVFHRDVEAARR